MMIPRRIVVDKTGYHCAVAYVSALGCGRGEEEHEEAAVAEGISSLLSVCTIVSPDPIGWRIYDGKKKKMTKKKTKRGENEYDEYLQMTAR